MHMVIWVIVYVGVLKVCETSLTVSPSVYEEFHALCICKEEETLSC